MSSCPSRKWGCARVRQGPREESRPLDATVSRPNAPLPPLPSLADGGGDQILADALALVGGTPVVRLRHTPPDSAEVVCKIEWMNPGGSVKDRIALAMVLAAEAEGQLHPGDTIVEATSGNTGIGLAVVAAVRDYKLVLAMPEDMNAERRALFAWYGVELVLTPAAEGMGGAVFAVEEIVRQRGAFWPRQFENPQNPAAHEAGTGPELLAQCGGRLDALVAGVGTGGTLSGMARYLRAHLPGLRVVAVEPARSPVLGGGRPGPHRLLGLGAGFVPGVLDRSLIDTVLACSDEDGFETARHLACREGLLAGPSAGAAVWGALRVAAELGPGRRVAAILPDGGDRYTSMMPWALDAESRRRAASKGDLGRSRAGMGQAARLDAGLGMRGAGARESVRSDLGREAPGGIEPSGRRRAASKGDLGQSRAGMEQAARPRREGDTHSSGPHG